MLCLESGLVLHIKIFLVDFSYSKYFAFQQSGVPGDLLFARVSVLYFTVCRHVKQARILFTESLSTLLSLCMPLASTCLFIAYEGLRGAYRAKAIGGAFQAF